MKSLFKPLRETFLRCRLLQRISTTSAIKFQPNFDPQHYTQGRWLDRDNERREARTLHFDFHALLDVAVKSSPGARHVIHCEKREGGFNRVFIIHLDNQSTVIARLPTRIAGPPSLTVGSEMATLKYVREKTTVPVPKPLAWSTKRSNSIGEEYIIEEAVTGVSLKDVWCHMTASQHVACIRSIGRLCKELSRLNFQALGSLYLESDAPSGAVRLEDGYRIGPVSAAHHWNCDIDGKGPGIQSNGNQGPWCSTQSYFASHVERAHHRRRRLTSSTAGMSQPDLLEVFGRTLQQLNLSDTIQLAEKPMLYHPDLHTRNIFVDAEDHTKITGLIDWQSAAIEPAFVFAAEFPDFAEELPEQQDTQNLTEEEQTAVKRLQADSEFCNKTWIVMQQTIDKLRPASRLSPILLRFLAAPSFGWLDKEDSLETLLNDLAKAWKALDLPAESIYQPSQDEAVIQRLDEYQARRELQQWLTRELDCDNDGWVAADRWNEVLPQYRHTYQRFVQSVTESESGGNEADRSAAMAKANRLWPFDLRVT